jgi:hypothetical protein
MKFKNLIFVLGISMPFFSFSQTKISSKLNMSKLTEVMILKNYTSEEIKELSMNEDKLKMLEYFYSKSFEILPNQNYTDDQYLKIDVNNFRLTRKKDEDVVIFDEISGLNILIYSLTKVEFGKKTVNPNYILDSEKVKKSNN